LGAGDLNKLLEETTPSKLIGGDAMQGLRNEGGAQELFQCDHNCGFQGLFDEVSRHELQCRRAGIQKDGGQSEEKMGNETWEEDAVAEENWDDGDWDGDWEDKKGEEGEEGEEEHGVVAEGTGEEPEAEGESDDGDADEEEEEEEERGKEDIAAIGHCVECSVSSLDANVEEDDMFPGTFYCNACWKKQLDAEEDWAGVAVVGATKAPVLLL
jgi:hypothetical protein